MITCENGVYILPSFRKSETRGYDGAENISKLNRSRSILNELPLPDDTQIMAYRFWPIFGKPLIMNNITGDGYVLEILFPFTFDMD